MKLIDGTSDVQKVAGYTDGEVVGEALRLSNNLKMTGMDYTAAVLQRLVDDIATIYGYGVKHD